MDVGPQTIGQFEQGEVCMVKYKLRNKNLNHDLRLQIFREFDDGRDTEESANYLKFASFVTAFLALALSA